MTWEEFNEWHKKEYPNYPYDDEDAMFWATIRCPHRFDGRCPVYNDVKTETLGGDVIFVEWKQ